MGRKFVIQDDQVITIDATDAVAKLQRNSERRALLNLIIDHGGNMTMREINAAMGFDARSKIAAMVGVGWLKVKS
jgi:hypothetical protein